MSIVSCVILTHDEQVNIDRCLKSLTWCDDIHILDSGSTDGTQEAASSAGVKFSWTTHIPANGFSPSTQRNWALEHLNFAHQWVLFVDADEVADVTFAAAVTEWVYTKSEDFDVAMCAPRFLYHGKFLRWTKNYPTWEPRIFHRDRARLLDGTWERLGSSTRIGRVSVPYDHYANSKGLDEWVLKHLRYAEWEAQRVSPLHSRRFPVSRSRKIAELAGGLRPWLVYAWFLIVRRGIVEGSAGRSYSRRMLIYELLIRERIEENSVTSRGDPL